MGRKYSPCMYRVSHKTIPKGVRHYDNLKGAATVKKTARCVCASVFDVVPDSILDTLAVDTPAGVTQEGVNISEVHDRYVYTNVHRISVYCRSSSRLIFFPLIPSLGLRDLLASDHQGPTPQPLLQNIATSTCRADLRREIRLRLL